MVGEPESLCVWRRVVEAYWLALGGASDAVYLSVLAGAYWLALVLACSWGPGGAYWWVSGAVCWWVRAQASQLGGVLALRLDRAGALAWGQGVAGWRALQVFLQQTAVASVGIAEGELNSSRGYFSFSHNSGH